MQHYYCTKVIRERPEFLVEKDHLVLTFTVGDDGVATVHINKRTRRTQSL